MKGSIRRLTVGLCFTAAVAAGAPAAAHADVWNELASTPSTAGAEIKPDRFRAFSVDKGRLRAGLAAAP